jgi:heme exporter protein D
MQPTTAKIRFDKSGYYFIALMALAFAGFWKSYFSKFFDGTNDYNFYFHFHAAMMVLWVAILIVQPILIRKKKLAVHRIIGKVTYVLMPVMLLSVLLIMNSGMKQIPAEEITFANVLFPVRDFFLLATAFSIGVWYRHHVQIHARAMVITGIVFIEPALFRFLGGVVFKGMGPVGFFVGVFLILSLLITLIILERKQKSARWLFPAFLIIDVIVYLVLIFQVPLSFLDPMVKWFAKLPLT